MITTIEQNDITQSSLDDIGGGSLSLAKYRSIYCDIPRSFINLVDLDEFENWYDSILENDPNKTNIMPMKLFIQKFSISREQFDKANLSLAKSVKTGFKGQPVINPQDFANQETNEIYNGDIIYTFDDQIINNYYLSHDYPYIYDFEFEEAVEKGEYKSQSEEWVDLEALEAEVVAKYGNIEYETKSMEKLENIYES